MSNTLSTGAIAKLCHVSCRTAQRWLDSGLLKGVYRLPISGDRRVPRACVIAFMEQHGMPLGDLAEEQYHHILLVGSKLDRLQALLPESQGYRYQFTSSVFEAGLLCGSSHPDTVIVDMAVGRAESLQVVASLREDAGHAGTQIVALACEDEPRPGKLLDLGFSHVFKKPFALAELAEAIKAQDAGPR